MKEQHYTVTQVAKLWGMSPNAVRKLFAHEPDVLKLSRPEKRFKRGYTTYFIPESAMRRVHNQLCRGATMP
jgi:hypothetical protein